MNALTISDARRFVLAGKAVVTLANTATGGRFTFKVTRSKDGDKREPTYFVKVLAGPDNSSDYRYVGFVRHEQFIHGGAKSFADKSAPSVVAFEWFTRRVLFGTSPVSDKLAVYHEGRCGRCGRRLTVPESIESGLGPECAGKAA